MGSQRWSAILKGGVLSGLLCLIAAPAIGASGSGITYHGRLLKPDGRPVTSSNVQFRLEIRTPAPSSCLLFQETHSVDLSSSGGVFAITLNSGEATSGNKEPYTLLEAFQNLKTLNFPSSKCLGADTEYTPNAADGRQLHVFFNDGSFADWEPLPSQSINFSPLALEAMSLGGHRPSNFFRVQDPAGPVNTMTPWSVAAYQKLRDLVANTTVSGSSVSVSGTSSGFTGVLAGDVTGGQNSTKVQGLQGRAVLDTLPSDQQVLTWNHAQSRWEPRNVPVAGNPDWSDITNKPTSLPPSGAAGGDLLGSTYPNPVIANGVVFGAKIADQGVGFSKLTNGSATGQVLRYDAGTTTWSPTKLHFMDLVNGHGVSPWPGTCGAGEAIVWNMVSDSFMCRLVSLNALLPDQSGQNGKVLQTDGTSASWVLPNDNAGITSINGSTSAAQVFAVAQGNTAPVFSTSGNTHTLNIPLASSAGVTSGTISHTDYQNFSSKQAALGFTPLHPANNLSELANTAAARTNLGLGTAATKNTGLMTGDVVEVGAGGKIPLSLLPDIPLAKTTGVLPLTQGGTGAVSQSAAINALLPSQSSQAGKILQTDGSDVHWVDTPSLTETDPKVGANTLNRLSKWDGTALVASAVHESGGSVGIGTTNLTSLLTVNGDITNAGSVNNPSVNVNFSTGNIQHTDLNCQSFVLNNMKDGGAYTFAVKGTSVATCSFTAYSGLGSGVLTVHMPIDHGATITAKHTLYNFLVIGSDVYVSWSPGL